jgi:hypothetical protein
MSRQLTREEAEFLMASGRFRVTYRDDSLPHQIRQSFRGDSWISVSCACRQRAGLEPFEWRPKWTGPEAQAVYAAHLAAEDVGEAHA